MSKRTRTDLTSGEKNEILDRYRKLPKLSQEEAANRLGIKRELLRNLLTDEPRIRETCQSETVSRKRQRSGKDVEVEEALWKWLKIARLHGVPVHGPTLCVKAEMLACKLGKEDFKVSSPNFSPLIFSHFETFP